MIEGKEDKVMRKKPQFNLWLNTEKYWNFLFLLLLMWLTILSCRQVYGLPVTWSGSGLDDNWSNGTNWLDGVPPVSTDSVTFNATDSGNINLVDADFTISPSCNISAIAHIPQISTAQVICKSMDHFM
jgi:hypothetical protein